MGAAITSSGKRLKCCACILDCSSGFALTDDNYKLSFEE